MEEEVPEQHALLIVQEPEKPSVLVRNQPERQVEPAGGAARDALRVLGIAKELRESVREGQTTLSGIGDHGFQPVLADLAPIIEQAVLRHGGFERVEGAVEAALEGGKPLVGHVLIRAAPSPKLGVRTRGKPPLLRIVHARFRVAYARLGI